MEKLQSWIKECFNTKGRWNRKKFWLYPLGITLITLIPLIITVIILLLIGGEESNPLDKLLVGLVVIWYVFIIYVSVLSYIKRLRDLNKNPWMSLILFVPFVSLALLIYCGFWRGTVGDNKYGPDPLGGVSTTPATSDSNSEKSEEL